MSLTTVLLLVLPFLQPGTPRLDTFERIDTSQGPVWTLRDTDRDDGLFLGAVFACRGDVRPLIGVYLGPFPPGRSLQLAVRDPEGEVFRFGRVLLAGPESGNHNVSLDVPAEQQRFVAVALRRGALISNGYVSFWNMASDPENQAVLDGLRDCGLGS